MMSASSVVTCTAVAHGRCSATNLATSASASFAAGATGNRSPAKEEISGWSADARSPNSPSNSWESCNGLPGPTVGAALACSRAALIACDGVGAAVSAEAFGDAVVGSFFFAAACTRRRSARAVVPKVGADGLGAETSGASANAAGGDLAFALVRPQPRQRTRSA